MAQVAEALRAHHVPPQRLVLEVTEHAVATDLDELIRAADRAARDRASGSRWTTSAPGTRRWGSCARLPVDILKIDHSLVAEHEPSAGAGRRAPRWSTSSCGWATGLGWR